MARFGTGDPRSPSEFVPSRKMGSCARLLCFSGRCPQSGSGRRVGPADSKCPARCQKSRFPRRIPPGKRLALHDRHTFAGWKSILSGRSSRYEWDRTDGRCSLSEGTSTWKGLSHWSVPGDVPFGIRLALRGSRPFSGCDRLSLPGRRRPKMACRR